MPTVLLLVLIGVTIALIAVFVFRSQIMQMGKSQHFRPYLPVLSAEMGASAPSGFRED